MDSDYFKALYKECAYEAADKSIDIALSISSTLSYDRKYDRIHNDRNYDKSYAVDRRKLLEMNQSAYQSTRIIKQISLEKKRFKKSMLALIKKKFSLRAANNILKYISVGKKMIAHGGIDDFGDSAMYVMPKYRYFLS